MLRAIFLSLIFLSPYLSVSSLDYRLNLILH